MRSYFAVFLFLLTGFGLGAQTVSDALRYSDFTYGATGRAIGAGGAFSALGADFSLISANPAGLAAFRRSEFVITPGLFSNATDASLAGADNGFFEDQKTKFHLANAGLILVGNPSPEHWKTANFSLGVSRLANFHQAFFAEGMVDGSITDRWLELAQGKLPSQLDEFEAGPAYDVGALIPTGTDGAYITDFSQAPGIPVLKQQSLTRSGAINEFSISMAGNYEDRIYAGVSVGIPFVTYEEEKIYEETDEDSTIPAFNELEYRENLRTTGAGINLKLGLIYRINQMVRLGGAIHTPSWLGLSDNYSTNMIYDYTDANNNGPLEQESPEGSFDYNLATPWRFLGSAGFIFGKHGFISAEAEWVNFGNTSFNFDTNNSDDLSYERELNRNVADTYQSALNLRLGGELVMDILRFRAGFGLVGDPYVANGETRTTYSAGIGLRDRGFYLDLGYQGQTFDQGVWAYQTTDASSQLIQTEVNPNWFVLTFGFKM